MAELEFVDPDSLTPPMALNRSDRVKLEERMNDLQREVREHITSEREARAELAYAVASLRGMIWFFGGVAAAALLVVLVMLLRH